MAAEAAKRGVDGVICGHIHHATIKTIDGVLYVNIGDFVESCTAIAEHADGRFEILHWRSTAGAARAREGRAVATNRKSRRLMRILIATDAWRPQVNGVVRSLESMAQAAGADGRANSIS